MFPSSKISVSRHVTAYSHYLFTNFDCLNLKKIVVLVRTAELFKLFFFDLISVAVFLD